MVDGVGSLYTDVASLSQNILTVVLHVRGPCTWMSSSLMMSCWALTYIHVTGKGSVLSVRWIDSAHRSYSRARYLLILRPESPLFILVITYMLSSKIMTGGGGGRVKAPFCADHVERK